jgi:predicted phage terminase large subunit-like protein
MLPHKEALYGGAAGGMKSETLLYDATRYLHIPGYSAILFRKTLTDHELPSALIPRAKKYLLGKPGVKWDGSNHRFIVETTYPDGTPGPSSTLQFGYIGDQDAQLRYQSSEYAYIGWDEVTQHRLSDYTYLFSRLRKTVCPVHQIVDGVPNYVKGCMKCDVAKSIPAKVRGATNPGGPGHSAFKNRFGITSVKGSDGEPLIDAYGHKVYRASDPNKRPFLQSFLEDNPFIDQKSYRESLEELPHLEKMRLLHGDWDVNPDARFQLSDFQTYTAAHSGYFRMGDRLVCRGDFVKVFLTIDSAASAAEGLSPDHRKDEPSWFVISCWGETADKHLLWLDMDRFQAEVPEGIRRVKAMFMKHRCIGYCEKNGVGAGVYQELARAGFNVIPMDRRSDKVTNATEAMVRVAQHRVWLPDTALWLKPVHDEINSWTGGKNEEDDIIDTLADAARMVAWGEVGAADIMSIANHFASDVGTESPFMISFDDIPYDEGYDPYLTY